LQVRYPVNVNGSTGASAAGAVNTPWNVIMVGADLDMLVNNDIVESLAPAPDPLLFPEGEFPDWISTGRSVWDWLRPQSGGITAVNAMTNSLWASRLGFEYNTIDEGWGNWNVGNPWPQVQQVVEFSHARGVKVLLWKRSVELSSAAQRTAFFKQLQSYGIDGFKADFFDFNSANAGAAERLQ
jgi:alpha-glucosidase